MVERKTSRKELHRCTRIPIPPAALCLSGIWSKVAAAKAAKGLWETSFGGFTILVISEEVVVVVVAVRF